MLRQLQGLAFGLVGTLVVAGTAEADVILTQYTFPHTTAAALNPTTVDPAVNATAITGSPTVNNQPTSNIGLSTGVGYADEPFLIVSRAASNEAGVRSDVYFRFTVTAEDGKQLDLTTLTFDVAQGGGTALTRDYDVRSSVDNFASSLTGDSPVLIPTVRPTPTSVSVDLSSLPAVSSITFEFRFFAPGSFQNIDFDNITVNGTVVPEPAIVSLLLPGLPLLSRRRRARV